ncbi:hypothetical protein F2Q70_00029562 [Brassica cretica]|uniref:Uncharacterized protein n=1 Tax=Brassica cretica TaxID=69181 RepID=A0A8S9FLK3_BRACR|nr:hypothetical protein F2Q70_00029562 [Brassica cretica]
MAPLRRLRSCFFDDGPRSGIREGDQANMRRKYAIHPSVGKRCPTEFECASDGGAGEVAVYEAYLEAGFRGVIPSLIGEVSSFFASLRQDITLVILRSQVPLRTEPHSEPGGGPVPLFQTGETVEPEALMFPEEELVC